LLADDRPRQGLKCIAAQAKRKAPVVLDQICKDSIAFGKLAGRAPPILRHGQGLAPQF
jgi:hypothetical protein